MDGLLETTLINEVSKPNGDTNFETEFSANTEPTADLPLLGYWKIRGLAQPVRFMLVYTGTKFQEKWYEIGADLSRESWLKEKHTLGLELPNLPYWIDGDLKMTQSRAILRHIARSKDPRLLGTTALEERRLDILENHVWDVWMALIMLCFRYSHANKVEFLQSLPEQLELISNFIGEQAWSVSDNLTYVDFIVYEALYQHKVFAPNCLHGFPRLQKLINDFETLPSISKYMLTEAYIHAPLYTRLAIHYI